MKLQKSTKIAIILVIAIMAIMLFATLVEAAPITDPIENPGSYNPTQSNVETTKVAKIGGIIVGIIRTVGTVASIIMLIILGLKYMTGSTQDKAKYKESMIPYIVGMVMLVAVVNILGILYNIFSGVTF